MTFTLRNRAVADGRSGPPHLTIPFYALTPDVTSMGPPPADHPSEDRSASRSSRPSWPQELLGNSPQPMLLVTGDGVVAEANSPAAELFGVRAQRLIGWEVAELLIQETDDPQAPPVHAEAWPIETTEELWALRPDGGRCPIEVTPLPLGSPKQTGGRLLILRDISERRETEDELRYKKALLESQNEASVDGILIVDHESQVVSMNQRFIDLWGVDQDLLEVGGRDDEALASVLDRLEDPDEFLEKIEWLHEHPEAETRDEVHFKDGRVFERWSTPVYGEDGTYYGRGWYFRDITDRKRAEEALARYAREEARLVELEQLLTVTSHNLVTPLRQLLLYTQLLDRRFEGELGEEGDEYVEYIVHGAQQMSALLEDLRTYAEVGSKRSQLAEVDLEPIVDESLRTLEDLIEETGAEVTRDELPRLAVDAAQMRILLTQLVENALRFRRSVPPKIHIGVEPEGHHWRFSVQDNGVGIAERHQGRVFSLFERLDPQTYPEGTGIGLAICRRIVERHGGRIWVESEPEQGSTFHFTMPEEPPQEDPLDMAQRMELTGRHRSAVSQR